MENGHRITPQRLAIVNILAKSKGHASVENIHVQIKKDFLTMSLATVYKNIILINSLVEVFGCEDSQEKFLHDFVAVWNEEMNLDRFALA